MPRGSEIGLNRTSDVFPTSMDKNSKSRWWRISYRESWRIEHSLTHSSIMGAFCRVLSMTSQDYLDQLRLLLRCFAKLTVSSAVSNNIHIHWCANHIPSSDELWKFIKDPQLRLENEAARQIVRRWWKFHLLTLRRTNPIKSNQNDSSIAQITSKRAHDCLLVWFSFPNLFPQVWLNIISHYSNN